MNFNEKLQKMRKDAKLSQEELADMLDVTRQSVSKWESGQTYPEMDKLLALCKIFECTLEELTNDDINFDDFSRENKNSININSIVDIVLSFINKTYNYFTHIKFKEFIKCILTMIIVFMVIRLLWYPFSELEYAIQNFLRIIKSPFINSYLNSIITFIIEITYIFMGTALFIYIFKIGFLDRVDVLKEDSFVINDEEELSNNIENVELKKKKPKKFVVRSYSNFENRFLSALGKLFMFFVKVFLTFIAVPFVILIVFFSFCLAISVSLMFQGVILVGIVLGLIFAIMLTSLVIEFICNIILNRKHNARKMLIILLISLVGGGISSGILAMEITKYEIVDETLTNTLFKQDIYTFNYKNGMYIESYDGGYSTKTDDTMKDGEIRIEVNNYENLDYLYVTEDTTSNSLIIHRNRVDSIKINEYIDLIIKSLKEKKIYTYYDIDNSRFVIYANKETLKKLDSNWQNKEAERIRDNYESENSNMRKMIKDLESEKKELERSNSSLEENNDKLTKKISELEEKINDYKEKISSIIE